MTAKAISNIKIKPCPFCGGKAEMSDPALYDAGGHVECSNGECDALGPFRDDCLGAIALWNSRPTEDMYKAALEEIADAPIAQTGECFVHPVNVVALAREVLKK